jgi:(E)-4-hydroxy-3-methylbut-2-enyl-diphosphate synthase
MQPTAPITNRYNLDLTNYHRRMSREVSIGELKLGGLNPIRVQSMTTIDTMDTVGSVEQSIRMIEAGCELVRITAPSIKEAANLEHIKRELRARGYNTPLVADIHFTPNAAELAARLVEKVRVNPGNYADRKKFEHIDYTDATYADELERIRERFLPLIKICKEYGTAMRIGTNHGSLSDRILSRFGDTPLGMVESALEFVRICEDEGYYDLVISMKASNTQVMVQAYRLLVQQLEAQNLQPYPLHLGVTEAGEAEDGRIKSAVGIGTLLEDGLGDTVRVSLTEEPEFEIPVAKALVDRYTNRPNHKPLPPLPHKLYPIDPYQYRRRQTREVLNIGGHNVPRVVGDMSALLATGPIEMADLKTIGHHYLPATDKWALTDQGADLVYTGSEPASFMIANGSRQVLDAPAWTADGCDQNKYPFWMLAEDFLKAEQRHPEINLVRVKAETAAGAVLQLLNLDPTVVVVLYTQSKHTMPALRWFFAWVTQWGCDFPIIIQRSYKNLADDELQLFAATDLGGLLIDGLGDGVWMTQKRVGEQTRAEVLHHCQNYNTTSFGILQAARTRMSKTEYISCPSCGRTLFDLQETTAMIRKRTDHLKGIKIGIMGCIVNGPGEMADADYGYVGVGKDRIALYRGQNVVKKSVPADQAVDQLIELIKEDDCWIEKEQ